jgi:hypothetical protein
LAKLSEQARMRKPQLKPNLTGFLAVPDRTISRARFKQLLTLHFFVRFHMLLILTGTGLSGVSVSKLLLELGIGSMAIRYPIAVASSYFVFFCLIRLWLWYIAKEPARESDVEILDAASESWMETAIDQSIHPGLSDSSSAASTWSTSSGESNDSIFNFDFDVDGEGIFALIALALLLLVILGGALILIYQAPAILAEAAFQGALASALTKASQRIDRGDWVGSVFKATWVPLSIVLLMAVVFGVAASKYCPAATKAAEVFYACKSQVEE